MLAPSDPPATKPVPLDRALREADGPSTALTLEEVPCEGHSTLTFDYPLALARGHDTRRCVFDHLAHRLKDMPGI